MPTVLKRALILLLAPAVLLAGLYVWVVLRSPGPDSGKLVRTADRKIVWSGSLVQVQLHVNADQELPIRTDNTVRPPHVIALVIDHSGSMGQGPESPLEAVKSAAAIFARVTASSEQPVGAISFDDTPSEVMALTPDGEASANAIQLIPPGGGTDIAKAVVAGRDMIVAGLRSGKYPRATGLIVLLSDGQSDSSQALPAADQIKNDPTYPIRIITIGLGSQVDEELLRQMASSEADFHFTLDPGALGDIYSTIAADFGTAIGYNGQLAEQFNYGGFKLEKQPAGFSLQSDPGRGQFNFRFPVLFQQRLTIPYTLRAQKVGLYGLALKSAELTYVPDPNRPDQVRQIASSLSPPLLVITPWLLALLYLPLLAYLIWQILRLFSKAAPPAPEPKPIPKIVLPPPLPLRQPEPIREREPQPTLFLGVGGDGRQILAHVARLLASDRYLSQAEDPPFHLLYADTREAESRASDARFPIRNARLPSSLTGPVRQLQNSPKLPAHLDWVPRRELAEVAGSQLDLSQGSHGRRWLTRLALFEACRDGDTPFLQEWARAVQWLIEHPKARILIVGSLGSGTGSALATDLAFLLRQALPANYRAEWPIYALGLADIPSGHAYARSNQQAFLSELDRLTVATHVPQPAVFNPAPPPGFEYLDGVIAEPVYDQFFLLQSPPNARQETIDREFFSQVAAICHIFTEHSLADTFEAHLGNARTLEEQYQTQNLEGTVHSAWQYLLRFPVPEIARRLACRFVCEILGTNRLVGVALSADGRRLEPPTLPTNPVEEAVNQWTRLSVSEHEAPLYRAYCQAAVTRDGRTAAPAMQHAAQGSAPSLEDFRDGLRHFATRWFYLLLNGSPDDHDDDRADWCRHKILLLHGALTQLVEFGRAALALQQQRNGNTAANDSASLIAEIQRFHEEWLAQVSSWLQTLIAPEFVSPAQPVAFKGVYRSASDEYQQIEQRLADESSSAWQSLLTSENVQDSRLGEDALYSQHIGSFLEKERGFLLRWHWEFTDASGDSIPELRLRVVTDTVRDYAPGADTAQALLSDLLQLSDSLTRELDRITIFSALRSETGELHLNPLVEWLAGLISGDRGLRINRQFPGGKQIQRQVFVMIPALQDQELQKFQEELRHHLGPNLTLVRHGDSHVIRAVVVDSVIPIKAAQLQPATAASAPPFIFIPEQEGERIRQEITEQLGVAPCPQFHPLTRLLVAAPRQRAEWIGILAEDCIKTSYGDGIHPTLSIVNGSSEEPLLYEHQGQSWIWAVLNLAYKVRGVGLAETVWLRWQARDQQTKVERLDQAVRTWQERADVLPENSPERPILSQIVLLIRLEHELEQRRYQEANV